MNVLDLDQENTIKNSFKADYLKDDLKLAKQFEEYDFDFEDDEF